MREIKVIFILIVLVHKIECRTYCDDSKCVCLNETNSFEVTCTSHPTVLDANYNLPENITTLNLSANNLTSIQQTFISDSLIELLLAKNLIKEISTNAFSLPSLIILDLSHNCLQFMDRNAFAQIKNLQYLNLGSNQFTTLENMNFSPLQFLRELILDDNNIGLSLENHSLFEGGCLLTDNIQTISLKNVNLSDKNMNMFTDAKENLRNLTLAYNNLSTVVVLPIKLVYLDISNNPIKNISWDDFFDARYLTVLKLNNILIEEVPDHAFLYLYSLQELELAGNVPLKKVSPLAFGSVIVRDQIDLLVENLTLRGANLTTLESRMAGIFKKIKRVDLRDNPWHCDCEITWLQQIPIPNEFVDFRCSTPQHLKNQRVLEVNTSELICVKKHLRNYQNTTISIVTYCLLLAAAVLTMYLFIFSPKPIIYRQLPVEFPHTP